jgi:hypothetical protein
VRSSHREHPLDRAAGPIANGRVHLDPVLHGLEGVQDLRQRDPLHVRAEVAGPDELHGRELDGHVVGHGALRHQHDAGRTSLAEVADHARRRADVISRGEHVGRALGVGEDVDVGVLAAERSDLVAREALVHLAVALPENDLGLRARRHVAAEVLVGQEDHPRDLQ